jgi:glycerol kinase
MQEAILSIDQGTTSSRAMVFDSLGRVIASAQQEFDQYFPDNGWVEHKPDDIWRTCLESAQRVFAEAESQGFKVSAIGITNQRETSVIWDKRDGRVLANAIVWQDRRTAEYCNHLRSQNLEPEIQSRSGLLLDPYFSATKLKWMLDHVAGARSLAEQGHLAFGTVDCYLVSKLTANKQHLTDATNASRTNLFNLHTQQWDEDLCRIFSVPSSCLPRVLDCADEFGVSDKTFFGREIPILGVAGDQHAAAFGQCCFEAGETKSTYGTGCFVLMNTGTEVLQSSNRMLTTMAYRLNGKAHYALEGSIFMAGAAVQWLRDSMGLIKDARDTEAMASVMTSNDGVYLVPAFTGLGAPHWDAQARAAIFGMTRATGPRHIVRATLESIAYQTYDLFKAMEADGMACLELKVDGGMVANRWFLQFLSDTLSVQVKRSEIAETTALGAAYLAGLKAGIFDSLERLRSHWRCDAEFRPNGDEQKRQLNLSGWQNSVAKCLES